MPIYRTAFIALFTGCFAGAPSASAFDASMQMTGATFVEACSRADTNWISFCDGYAQAAVDSLSRDDGICLPSGISRTTVVTVAHQTIRDSPELQPINALGAVRLALLFAYRCK